MKSHSKFINRSNPTFNGFVHDGRVSCYDERGNSCEVSSEEFKSVNYTSIYKGVSRTEKDIQSMRKPKSQKGRDNIAKSNRENKKFGTNNHFFGKQHTDETKKKISTNRRKNNSGEYHPNGNRTAKKFKFTNPLGEEFVVFNSSRKFGKEQKIDVRKFEKLPEGEIFQIKQLRPNTPQETINTVGWSRITIKS